MTVVMDQYQLLDATMLIIARKPAVSLATRRCAMRPGHMMQALRKAMIHRVNEQIGDFLPCGRVIPHQALRIPLWETHSVFP
ncbi:MULTISPECIES: hypothetical protein [Glutamicibacter]|uniref:hypothetical protein n=1 Tax=Glutamicibacter TaxID=1742989 RepID=UPI00093F4308|nr:MULTISPECIES: hypothetical protein [Glutamicibacter]QEP08362.1 hypothetical protein F0M17_14500 [Glutamicibacter sp. ZJUTW]WIV43589.1 hypothetical protein QQS42_14930 [Glutamicibacter nicotianae]